MAGLLKSAWSMRIEKVAALFGRLGPGGLEEHKRHVPDQGGVQVLARIGMGGARAGQGQQGSQGVPEHHKAPVHGGNRPAVPF